VTKSKELAKQRFRDVDADVLIGRKIVDQISQVYASETGKKVNSQDRKLLELMILGDDIFSDVLKYGKMLAPTLLDVAKPIVSSFFPQAKGAIDSLSSMISPVMHNKSSESITVRRRYLLANIAGNT